MPGDGNPLYCDPDFVHVTIGNGTFVQGQTLDGLRKTFSGNLFFTCQKSVLHVYQETKHGIQCSDLQLKTVVFGSGTYWWRTDQTHPFDPTDCKN